MLRRLAVLLALLALLPPAAAKSDGPDFVVTLAAGTPPAYEGPAGLARLAQESPGERYAWNLTLTQPYTVGEFRVHGAFEVARVQQVVPMLEGIPDDQYPLFHLSPDDKLWTADGPAQVYRFNGTPWSFVLRVGLVGPANVTLVLQRDVTPPSFTLGQVTNVTRFGFYQETRTGELAIANLRVRAAGEGDGAWVENPTPELHVLQRFPIQGLGADTEHEAQVVFTDWAGNENRSPVYRVRTAPAPVLPKPTVTPLEPAPDATLPNGSVLVRARVLSPESPVPQGAVRLFFDKREVHEGFLLEGEEFTYRPPQDLAPGLHTVSVEATNAAGGRGGAAWDFHVKGAERTPGAGVALGVAAVALALLVLGRR